MIDTMLFALNLFGAKAIIVYVVVIVAIIAIVAYSTMRRGTPGRM